jgi:hypothetical protein
VLEQDITQDCDYRQEKDGQACEKRGGVRGALRVGAAG